MTTRMVVLPWDSVIKFMAKWYQGHCDLGSSMSLPTGRVLGTLVWAQAVQEDAFW